MPSDQLQLPLFDPQGPPTVTPTASTGVAETVASPSDVRAFLLQLKALSKGRIAQLTLTRNRSTILSAKPLNAEPHTPTGGLPKQVHLRIHRCFIGATDHVLQAAADFAGKRLSKQRRREALAVLREHYDHHAPQDAKPALPRHEFQGLAQGEHHDLQPIYAALNRKYFDDSLDLTVSWGSPVRRRRRHRRTIQLGSFQDETQSIRLHPILDRNDVPTYVVEAVVHHEMVHAVVPTEKSATGTRRRVHTPEFRRREREFESLERAERWLESNLFRLMARVERELRK